MLEVCVDTIQSALNAEKGGASRIELCSALSEGGLTPTVGLLKTIKSTLSIPIYAMLRPRRGMDFVYSDEEISSMKYDALQLKRVGADGFVFGVLNPDATVNTNVCKDFLEIISPLPATFHRAFDFVPDPFNSLTRLIQLGFSRVLTSGQACSAVDGISLLKELTELAKDRINIMPGGGINASNVGEILSKVPATKEIHASCRMPIITNYPSHKNSCALGSNDSLTEFLITNVDTVRELVTAISLHVKK